MNLGPQVAKIRVDKEKPISPKKHENAHRIRKKKKEEKNIDLRHVLS